MTDPRSTAANRIPGLHHLMLAASRAQRTADLLAGIRGCRPEKASPERGVGWQRRAALHPSDDTVGEVWPVEVHQ